MGLKGKKKDRGIQETFMKWTVGVDRRIAGYMLREKMGREK